MTEATASAEWSSFRDSIVCRLAASADMEHTTLANAKTSADDVPSGMSKWRA
jgi:hypothetical protein